jgi:hypothetical protein
VIWVRARAWPAPLADAGFCPDERTFRVVVCGLAGVAGQALAVCQAEWRRPLADPALRAGMEAAGVEGAPRIEIFTDV